MPKKSEKWCPLLHFFWCNVDEFQKELDNPFNISETWIFVPYCNDYHTIKFKYNRCKLITHVCLGSDNSKYGKTITDAINCYISQNFDHTTLNDCVENALIDHFNDLLLDIDDTYRQKYYIK
jgi:hypothetical protein